MLRQIQHAVDPIPSLGDALGRWGEIAAVLDERARKRRLQVEELMLV